MILICPPPFLLVIIIIILYFYCIKPTLENRQVHTVNWASIATSRGDHLPDFSYCGYHNSENPLPYINTPDISIEAPEDAAADMTSAIQEAIDAVFNSGGGQVKIPPGTFSIAAGIQIRSNVILTGSGRDETTLTLREAPSVPVFTLSNGRNATKPKYGFRSNITDDYVPIGTSVVTVVNSTGFAINQSVYVARTATEAWIRDNGMSDLVRDGVAQTWIPENKRIMSPGKVKAINSTQIALEIPLTDALDAAYMDPELIAYTPPELGAEIGLANLHIKVLNTCSGVPLNNTACNAPAVLFPSWTVDSWVRGLVLTGFNSFVQVDQDAARITIQDVKMDRNRDIAGSALPIDILLAGSQILVQDCAQTGLPTTRCFTVATDSLAAGPNAVLRHSSSSDVQTIYPHERWATGLLVENTEVPVLFVNRGTKGSGHGWAMSAGVGWNLRGRVEVESPSLGVNWCVGCVGEDGDGTRGNGTFIRPGEEVRPESLFRAQLEARGVK